MRRPRGTDGAGKLDKLPNANDPKETSNLARNPEHSKHLTELKKILTKELKSQARPFGDMPSIMLSERSAKMHLGGGFHDVHCAGA